MRIKISKIFTIVLALIIFVILMTACGTGVDAVTISFESNGGSEVEPITVDAQSEVNLPMNPTKEGYNFDGWYLDNNTFEEPAIEILNSPITSDLVLYAKWIPEGQDPEIEEYIIKFNSNGGSLVDDILVEEGASFLMPNDPWQEGYVFSGWYFDANLTKPFNLAEVNDNIVDDTLELYANWTEAQADSVIINFEPNGGEYVAPIVEPAGEPITEPIPAKVGFDFGGWYSDPDLTILFIFTVMPEEDITLYAAWSLSEYTITFESDGGSIVDPIVQQVGTLVYQPEDPTKENYTFDTWYTDEELTNSYQFTVMPNQDKTLYASWIEADLTEGLDYYLLQNNTYEVTAYYGDSAEIVIPSTFNGLPVTRIGDEAFKNWHILGSIQMPSSVIAIGERAFKNCTNLNDVSLSNNIIHIGSEAFKNCTSLIGIDIPDGAISIGFRAFYGCSSLADIIVADSVIAIREDAFLETNWYQSQLDGEVYIGKVLYDYKGTMAPNTTIEVHEGTKGLTENIFLNENNLINIIIPDSVKYIGGGALDYTQWYESQNDGIVYAGKVLYSYKGNMPENTTINTASDTKGIAGGAFYFQNNLVEVNLSDNIKTIASYSFAYTGLTEIVIPASVYYKESPTYWGFIDLTIYCEVITEPSGWQDGWNPDNRADVIWGHGYDEVTYTFVTNGGSAVDPITAVVVNDSPITNLEGYYFAGWYENPDFLGNNVTFPYYSEIDITLYAKWSDEYIPSWGLTYLLTDNDTYQVTGYNGNDINVYIPYMHHGKEVDNIGEGAFSGHFNIESIYMPNTILYIGDYAFSGCASLETIYIPESVIFIGKAVFTYCMSLEFIEVDANNLNYASIDGVLFDNDAKRLISYPLGNSNTTYDIPQSVEIIEYKAFEASQVLESVTLGNIVKTIGESAFAYSIIETISITPSVTTIEKNAFQGCENLVNLTFEENSLLEQIGEGAFSYCIGLHEVELPSSLFSINNFAFEGCTNLESIVIGENITSIGTSAFINCTSLNSVTIDQITPFDLGTDPFYQTNQDLIIYVPNQSLGEYNGHPDWQNYTIEGF